MPGPRAGLLEDRLFSFHPIRVMELRPARSPMVLRDERRHMGETVSFQETLPYPIAAGVAAYQQHCGLHQPLEMPAGQGPWPMRAGRP